MATLETQYKNYQNENPKSDLSFEDWKKQLAENVVSSIQKLFDEIKTPEYKQKQIEENKLYLEKLTVDRELGYYVGEHIVNRYLPTLSTDMLHSRRVIEVSEEDKIENERLNTEWFSTTKHMPNWDGENESDKTKWDLYFQHNKMLEKKYLPNPLDCHLGLIKFNDEKEFKEGLQTSLWDCDMCSYNIDVENIKIDYDMVNGFTIITFQLDENIS
jgi:hypothetical protein